METILCSVVAFVAGGLVASFIERRYGAQIANAIADVRGDLATIKGAVAKIK